MQNGPHQHPLSPCIFFPSAYWPPSFWPPFSRMRFIFNGTCAETRFRLSAQRTSPFKSAGGRQFSRLLAAELCASAVVTLDTPCSEVVWRVLATHSSRQFPLHFPSCASLCAITFQLDFTHFLLCDLCELLFNIPQSSSFCSFLKTFATAFSPRPNVRKRYQHMLVP
jgi:hypothetical protein